MKLVRSYLSLSFARLSQWSAFMTLWFGAKSYEVLPDEAKEYHEAGRRAQVMLTTLRARREAVRYEQAHVWEHAVRP